MRKTKIMKEIAEYGEINVELVNDSSSKRKTNSESQQDSEKENSIEGQHAEETTVRKKYDNIREILINKMMTKKMK